MNLSHWMEEVQADPKTGKIMPKLFERSFYLTYTTLPTAGVYLS